MFNSTRKTLIAVGLIAAFAAGGAAFAGAATKIRSSSSGQREQRPAQTQLTGDAADKVKAAALAKVPGAKVLRAEEGGPDGSAYHVHVRRSDGTEVVVLVNASFEATSVQTRPAGGGPGGPGRGHRPGGPGDMRQEALTGTTAAKVKAAALAKVPGGTVLRAEQGGHGATYHAHVRRSDGTEVVVLVNASFEATSVEEFKRP